MLTLSPRRIGAVAAVTIGALALSACSPGSLGSSDPNAATTLSFLADNSETSVKIAISPTGTPRIRRSMPTPLPPQGVSRSCRRCSTADT